jgi:hypothetical protein
MFKLNVSLISHQQAVAEHRDLPNTEIFQSKDVASARSATLINPVLESLVVTPRFDT